MPVFRKRPNGDWEEISDEHAAFEEHTSHVMVMSVFFSLVLTAIFASGSANNSHDSGFGFLGIWTVLWIVMCAVYASFPKTTWAVTILLIIGFAAKH